MIGAVLRERRDFAVLLALSAIDAASYSVIAPTLPRISERLHAAPGRIGILAAAFSAASILGFGVAGRLVRRTTTVRILGASLLVMAAGSGGFIVASGWAGFLAARAAMGFASGGLWIGIAFATLERWPGQEYVCMSRVLAAYSVGGLIGPALGAIGGIHGPFAVYLVFALLGAVAVSSVSAPPADRSFEGDLAALRERGFWLAVGGIVFAMLALGVVEGVLPLHLATHLSQTEIGGLYVGMSLVVAASAGASGSFRPVPILLASTVPVVVGLGLVGATSSVAIWMLALAVAGIGVGAAYTGSLGVLIATVEPQRIVTAMVLWSQLALIGYLVGPLGGGGLAQAYGFRTIGFVPLAAALLLVAAYAGVARGPRERGPRTERP
jgi:MFS family permease